MLLDLSRGFVDDIDLCYAECFCRQDNNNSYIKITARRPHSANLTVREVPKTVSKPMAPKVARNIIDLTGVL